MFYFAPVICKCYLCPCYMVIIAKVRHHFHPHPQLLSAFRNCRVGRMKVEDGLSGEDYSPGEYEMQVDRGRCLPTVSEKLQEGFPPFVAEQLTAGSHRQTAWLPGIYMASDRCNTGRCTHVCKHISQQCTWINTSSKSLSSRQES